MFESTVTPTKKYIGWLQASLNLPCGYAGLGLGLGLFCVQLFALRASSRCQHHLGALLWLTVETVERVPTPSLWQTCKVLHPLGPFSGNYGILITSILSVVLFYSIL